MNEQTGNDKKRGKKVLARESKFLRVYRSRANVYIEHSKLIGEVELDATQFEKYWRALPLRDKVDLCRAYQSKPAITKADEQILNVIMKEGNERIWNNIVSVLTRHSNREQILAFVRNRLEHQPPPLANFYRAIEMLDDREAVPKLLEKYFQYQQGGLTPKKSSDRILRIDYLYCSRALWRLTGSQEYEQTIREFLSAADHIVFDAAKRLLE